MEIIAVNHIKKLIEILNLFIRSQICCKAAQNSEGDHTSCEFHHISFFFQPLVAHHDAFFPLAAWPISLHPGYDGGISSCNSSSSNNISRAAV